MKLSVGLAPNLRRSRRTLTLTLATTLVYCLVLGQGPAEASVATSSYADFSVPFSPPTHEPEGYLLTDRESGLDRVINDVTQATDCGGTMYVEAAYDHDVSVQSTYEWGRSEPRYECTGTRYVTGVTYRTMIIDNGVLPTADAKIRDVTQSSAEQDVATLGDRIDDIHGTGSTIVWFFRETVHLSDGATATACAYGWVEQGTPISMYPTECDSGENAAGSAAHLRT